jgi:hypothetical protein
MENEEKRFAGAVRIPGELFKAGKKIADMKLQLDQYIIHKDKDLDHGDENISKDNILVEGVIFFLDKSQELDLDTYEFRHRYMPNLPYEIKITKKIDSTSYECRLIGEQKILQLPLD